VSTKPTKRRHLSSGDKLIAAGFPDTPNALNTAFTHCYRLAAITDALRQDCSDLGASSRRELAAIAFSESMGLMNSLTALSEEGIE
jgi:hypothetical protein